MRMNYISKIQSNLKRYRTIHTNKITDRILDGSYNSIYKGRGMNFDELREYVIGDDLKDVDWKASARSQKMLIRQYVVEKKHNIMLVFDTNRRMLAESAAGVEKREIALLSLGTLGFLVTSNGDYVSAIYPTEKSVQYHPFRMGLMPLENILNDYHKQVSEKNKGNLNKSLDYIVRNIKRKMIVVVATDAKGVTEIDDVILKRLMVFHDVLFVNISDADLSGKNVYDIENGAYVPPFFTKDKKLARIEKKKKQAILDECEDKLKKFGIASTVVSDIDGIDNQIIELLEKHKTENR